MSKRQINVTQSFLPPFDEYAARLKEVWESGHLTNNGPNVLKLESDLKTHLGVKHLFLVNNGTIAIQIAIKALDLSGEVITTPFSYVATVSSLVWEGCTPVFVDINETDFCIDVAKIEAAITNKTTAILATHVYGHSCNVVEIERIAHKHDLKVIYDAAHAFGVTLNGTSVLNHGDISTLSFHATKIFHTGEGGALVTNDDELAHRIAYMRNFGHNGAEAFHGIGINGKVSEFHAAMGLCILPRMDGILSERKRVSDRYDGHLSTLSKAYRYDAAAQAGYNYSYYPFLLESEELLMELREELAKEKIFPRRYFYPALHTLPYLKSCSMPISESIAPRMLCLPLFTQLTDEEVDQICGIIKNCLEK
ncbi:MAG: DegT/DnrJ/EryC1/StrS family aminotransferase [Flavobacteriales bacterium]|nr:DegT/DnrJ/EryC1/StrS family aminotransferase [Flavobacteriales bacterium]